MNKEKKLEGGPFLVEEQQKCHACQYPIGKGAAGFFGPNGLAHATHYIGRMPKNIPTFSEWVKSA